VSTGSNPLSPASFDFWSFGIKYRTAFVPLDIIQLLV